MRKRGLGGWSRIGILLSVAWTMGVFVHLSNREATSKAIYVENVLELCQSAQRRGDRVGVDCYQDTVAQRDLTFSNTLPFWLDMLALGVIPLPFAWGLAWLSVFLFRWVRAGFAA